MSKYKISEQYETMCREMVGKRYNKLVVAEYLGVINLYDGKQNRKERVVKCYCDCGNELIASATRVRNNYIKSCKECLKFPHRGHGDSNPCWECVKATNKMLCQWAGGLPRNDWDAEPCITGGIETYKIKSCPGFEKYNSNREEINEHV